MIEVVMLSNCRDSAKEIMTRKAIESVRKSGEETRIILVDSSGRKDLKFGDSLIISVAGKFNYNRNLLIGMEYLSGAEYVLFLNNDTYTHVGALTRLKLMLSRYDSVSPRSPRWIYHKEFNGGVYEGFRTSFEFCGWAIMTRQSLFNEVPRETCFPLDLFFWYQDNYFADVLQVSGKRHALVGSAIIDHLQGKSHDIVKETGEYDAHTWGLKQKYEQLRAELYATPDTK